MAASMWEKIVQSYLDKNENSDIEKLAECVRAGNPNLLQLVEHLGPSLICPEVEKRCRGTQLLSEIISSTADGMLNEKEVSVLASFMCDRLRDHHSVVPYVLKAMAALSLSEHLKMEDMSRLLKGVSTDVHVQSLAQAHRRHLYNMLYHLLTHRLPDIQALGADFVYNYIQIMDGETDPRNLLLAFQCVTIIAANCSHGTFTEELFEVISCYFPVDFTPPPNDPHGIKKEDLVAGLQLAMASSPKFAQYCLPLLVEKLASTVMSAKIDSFGVLATCAEVYGPAGLREFLTSLWASIKREVFTASSDELRTSALSAIAALVRGLSIPGVQGEGTTDLDAFLRDILTDVDRYVCEHEQRLGQSTFDCLLTMAKASDPAYCHIATATVPRWLKHFEENAQVNQRLADVDKISRMVEAAAAAGHTVQATSPLHQHQPGIFALLTQCLDPAGSVELCEAGAGGCGVLLGLPGMVPPDQLIDLASRLLRLVMYGRQQGVRQSAVAPLSMMTEKYPPLIREHVLPPIAQRLKHEPMQVDSGNGDGSEVTASDEQLFSAMADIAVHEDVVTDVLPMFTERLHSLDKATEKPATDEVVTLCSSLYTLVQRMSPHPACLLLFSSHLWPRLLSLVVEGAGKGGGVFTDIQVVKAVARVFRVIAQNLDVSTAEQVLPSTVEMFLDGQGVFLPLTSSSPPEQSQLIHVLTAVICSLRPEIEIPRRTDVLDRVFRLSCESCHDDTIDGAARCVAGLINKMPQDDELDELLVTIHDQLRCVTSGGAGVERDVVRRALLVWTWITKALVLRSHHRQGHWIGLLVESLHLPLVGAVCAVGLERVMGECEDVLTRSQHARVTLLYRQRVFCIAAPAIREAYMTAQNEAKPNFLSALSHLLKYVPKQVLKTELPPLLPLLLESLSCKEPGVWHAILLTLEELLTDNPTLLADHVDELIPRILNHATYKPNMQVRMSALRCLGRLSGLPPAALFPHTRRVLRGLQPCLSDHKRHVRAEAARTRNIWCLLTTGK